MTSLSSQPQETLPPSFYENAMLYDLLRAGDDYDVWSELLLGLIEKHVPSRERLLDVGCGTGNSSITFARHGFQVTGCDISRTMLDAATAKNTDDNPIIYQCADMRDLPADLGLFNVVNWMDDVANHLLTLDDLTRAVRSSADRLAPEGILIFDVNSAATFEALATRHLVIDGDQVCYQIVPAHRHEPPYDHVTVRITSFVRDGDKWERHDNTIAEHYYTRDDIAAALNAAGLEIVEACSLHRDQLISPPDEQAYGKVVYAAQHRHQPGE